VRTQIAAALAVGSLAVLIGGAIAAPRPRRSAGGRDTDRAARAALAATRGGKAVKAGRESEDGATWEVEVLRPDSRRVDVLLDARFRVINVSDEREPNEWGADRNGSGGASSKRTDSEREAHLAARAAAKAVGGGMLMDVERDSEKGATWEVEFMKLDGTRVNVLLDDKLRVISVSRGKKAS